ncbi:MAG: coenzyme biosynthesis protein [Acidobacteriales bacterium]|nr:coenzyme biosynthesis protein [Terriglobales bacterium]
MTDKPLALIAELTHRCPLRCVYCSNPLELAGRKQELSTAEWVSIFEQAAAMGIMHAHFTGGEPLLRDDVVELVSAARKSGLYVNLITSGVGLSEGKLSKLVHAGLDHIQLSFQDFDEEAAAEISGVRVLAKKREAARLIRQTNLAFTVNLVVHRKNLDRLEELIAFAEGLGPQRIEIANVQYYGWAMENRSSLLPTREQVERSVEVLNRRKLAPHKNIAIDFVTPDYYGKYPKPCMGGWGRRLMLIDPAGRAMPCHAAAVIPNITFDNVRDKQLRWMWAESAAFQMFRGTEWMQEPCKTCPKQEHDFGGCRCQALLLAGDASAADPVCTLSNKRPLVDSVLQITNAVKESPPPHLPRTLPLIYRSNPS